MEEKIKNPAIIKESPVGGEKGGGEGERGRRGDWEWRRRGRRGEGASRRRGDAWFDISFSPLLLFSLVVPVVLASVRATAGVAEGLPLGEVAPWWRLLLVFDLVYVTASALLFPLVMEG